MPSGKKAKAGRGEVRTRIYEAAVDVFYQDGYSGATVRKIVRKAGVKVSSLYYYFGSKQGLLVAVMEETLRSSTDCIRERIEQGDGAAARLQAALKAHIEWHVANHRISFIADAELPRLTGANRTKIVRLRDEQESIFREIFADGLAQGEFSARDSGLLIRMLLSAATGVASWYRPDGPLPPEQIAEIFYETLSEGFRPRAEARRRSDSRKR